MNNETSPKQLQSIKSEMHLRMFLIVLTLLMFSLVVIFTASINATQKNYEFFTNAMRFINDPSHPNNQEVVGLLVQLKGGPADLTDSDLELVSQKILKGLNDSESAFWKSQFLDIFITADQTYREKNSKVARWEDLRTQINVALDRNKAEWMFEIEEMKQSFRTHLKESKPTYPLESIVNSLGATQDTYEELRRDVESTVLLTLDRSKSRFASPV